MQDSSRKKFIWWGAGLVTAFAGLRLFKGKNKNVEEKKKETVKMLTQDGKLVEIDRELMTAGKKISTEELKQWVNKKTKI
jgi:hypothetical protein